MRLLDTTTFELHSGDQQYFKSQGYAILSHRWVGAEITFDQIYNYSSELRNAGNHRLISPQLEKIHGACKTARDFGFSWMWIDNCCINKASATEESESINSMFKWYRDAQLCITYLSDVELRTSALPTRQSGSNISGKTDHTENSNQSVFQSLDGRTPSQWFSRLWCLQELLAPRDIQFYDTNWNFIGSKISLASQIEAITGISEQYLAGIKDFQEACIATKMSWLAGRIATRQEDIAYGALGIFNIMMVPQYGEGQRAFMRLQHQLLSTVPDESIFAWRMPDPNAGEKFGIVQSSETKWAPDEWGMLAPSPSWFKDCGNITIRGGAEIARPAQVFEKAREGIQVPISELEGATKYQAVFVASQFTVVGALPTYFYLKHHMKKKIMTGYTRALNCWVRDEKGKFAAVSICLQPTSSEHLELNQVNLQRIKRIRASEMILRYKYPRSEKVAGHGVVLQPELTYLD